MAAVMTIGMLEFLLVLLPLILGLLWLLKRTLTRSLRGLPLPPGPRPFPLIGNALHMPKDFQWLTYDKWAATFGDVMHVNVFGQSIVIISSAEAAIEFFEKRSLINSDRLFTPMMELSGIEWHLGLLPYGERWRQRRRLFHQYFNDKAAQLYQSLQTTQAHKYLCLLHAHPDDFFNITRDQFGKSILQAVYGFENEDTLSHFVHLNDKVVEALLETFIPGTFWVDFLPWLKHIPSWVPGARFRRRAAYFKKTMQAVVEEPIAAIYSRTMDTKNADTLPSMFDDVPEASGRGMAILRDTAAVAYVAGADSSVSTMLSFYLAMALYPDVQRLAQLELDAVVGPDRLPQFSDRDSLPYVNALIKECLRWQPVTPLAVPHRSTADDIYKDKYFIPKGSLLIGNVWSIVHDPSMYPSPEEFNPDRFVKEGKMNPDVMDPELFVFGFGRRICPGRYFASNALFINIASVLYKYSISPPLGESGQPIFPKVQMTSGFPSFPAKFDCVIKKRSAAAEALIVC